MCRVLDLEDVEASVEPLGLQIESGSVLFRIDLFTMIFYLFDDMLLTCSDMMVDDAG